MPESENEEDGIQRSFLWGSWRILCWFPVETIRSWKR